MPNIITLTFIPCSPEPTNGYRLTWRVAGSGDPYTDEGLFTESPAQFSDGINPEGTCYEGFLQSECIESGESGPVLGEAIPWTTPCEESGTTNYIIELTAPCAGETTSTYLISGATPGDVITVRASFIGTLQNIHPIVEATRADLAIWAAHGTSDATTSSCYTNPQPHPFSITVDTVITVVNTIEYLTTNAIIHNSPIGASNVVVSIIDINGQPPPQPIFVNGCRGQVIDHVSC